MPRKTPFFISTVIARELVHPDDLEECLSSLLKNGFIVRFNIGEDLTKIESSNKKRFEISHFFAEQSDFDVCGKVSKKASC